MSRVHIVTAGGGGIAGALIERLLADGDSVLAVDVSSRRLAALVDRSANAAARLDTLKADVADEAAAAGAVARCLERFGSLHGLANIAGGIVGIGEDLLDRPLERIGIDDFRQTLRLNLETAFVMTRAAVPAFRERRYGKVVNVASLAAFGNFDSMGNAAYDAAKAGVIGLTQTLCRSLGPDGIRVNVVAPGTVMTDRVAASFPADFIERQRARTPLRDLVGPGDVAEVLRFLLAPASDQVSGQVLRASGGLQ